MFKLLCFFLAFLQVFSLTPFLNYTRMCVGRKNCGLIFNHTKISGSNIDYSKIERYPSLWTTLTSENQSLAWAQSHAQAFTWSLWIQWWYQKRVAKTTFDIISELSVVKTVLQVTNYTCRSPLLSDLSRNYADHLPYLFLDPVVQTNQALFTKDGMPVNEYDRFNWCNKTFLNSFNLAGKMFYKFPGYDNYQFTNTTSFLTIFSAGLNRGMAIVGLPHDNLMANMYGFYPDGFYKLSGPRLFYQPANVVGYYKPSNNNTLYLIVYAFGANHVETNYLFVQASMISLPGWLTFFYPFDYSNWSL